MPAAADIQRRSPLHASLRFAHICYNNVVFSQVVFCLPACRQSCSMSLSRASRPGRDIEMLPGSTSGMEHHGISSQNRWRHNSAAMVVRRRRAVILRTWRLQAGLSVAQVSEALGLYSTRLIPALEAGLGDLGAQRVLRLARIYKVDHPLMLRVIRTGSAE